jgi:uncharacterized membrane protein YhaH (DUF805 family)
MDFLFSGKGRVTRRMYWLFVIGVVLISMFARMFDHGLGLGRGDGGGPISSIMSLLMVWPQIAVSAKRFHDRGMSGWWVFYFVLMTVAPVALLVATNTSALASIAEDSMPQLNAIGWVAVGVACAVQLWEFVILAFLPGEKSANRYGPNPRAA